MYRYFPNAGNIPGSSNGRTAVFGAVNLGSSPSPGTRDFGIVSKWKNTQKIFRILFIA